VRPWQHAMSSAHKGAAWLCDLEVHEFLDISKAACADRRHRVVLHHVDLGTRVAALAFPDRAGIAALVCGHVEQDLGFAATLADWLDRSDCALLPAPVKRRVAAGPEGVAKLVGNRLHPSQIPAARRVADFLFLPTDYYPADSEAALAVLMNSVGPSLVRRLFGPPRVETIDGKRVVTDWAWLAEAVIMACYGRIPELGELVRAIDPAPMGAARKPRRVA
jgi:uncharacterized protein DUF6915